MAQGTVSFHLPIKDESRALALDRIAKTQVQAGDRDQAHTTLVLALETAYRLKEDYNRAIFLSIDLQEMNWKFQAGFHEHTGVSLQHTCSTTHEEETPVCLRIQRSRATVKELHSRLQQAYQRDNVRLVRRLTVVLALLVHRVPMAVFCQRWGLSPSCLSAWQQALRLRRMDSLDYSRSGGRPPKWTPRHKKRLVELIEAGPLGVGCEPACGHSVRIRVRIWREFGVLYQRQYVCTMLHHLGLSLQKARLVSDHLDAVKRRAWLEEQWPAIVRAAKRCQGLILCEDEASFAQWGSLSYTWARRGHQPAVPTRGKRKGYKVCGAMEYCSGRLCSPSIAGRFHSETSQAFLPRMMEQTPEHLLFMHDGARYPTSASTQAFLAAHRDRITAHPLPSYSPDDNPIAYRWKKTKQRATHNKYFQECLARTVAVDKALAYFATHPDTVLGLLGRYCEESGLELKQAA
jgi:transposase